MNIMNKLTVRNLKENKRRTLVTIIGVIISVSMLTAVATLGVSFMDLFKRQSMAKDGEWHVQYQIDNSEQLEGIKKDSNTKKLSLSRELGYAKWNESQNISKPYLYFKQYNENGFKQFPITIKEGTFPSKENELLISEEMITDSEKEYKIGDEIQVDIGERIFSSGGDIKVLKQRDILHTNEKGKNVEQIRNATKETFKIVGIMERPDWESLWAPGFTAISYLDESIINSVDHVTVSVALNKVNRSIYSDSKKLAEQLNIDVITYNTELLRYYGVTNNDNLTKTMYSLVGIIMFIIIVGSVALIYNAFAISVSERARHLGMLSSVGATKKQKRNSVFFEGVIIGIISIPLGIIAGIGGIGITFVFINNYITDIFNTTQSLKVVVTPISVLISCLISILTIFISTYLPARKASKITAIDAIRQTHDIKIKGNKIKTNPLVRRLFGLEAEFGLKNLKRNRRRYQTTVFSLIISIVLFLTVAFFTNNLKKSVDLSQEDQNFDISISAGTNVTKEELLAFAEVPSITESNLIKHYNSYTFFSPDKVSDYHKELIREDSGVLFNGKYDYSVRINALSDESFRQYAEKANLDANDYMNPEHPTGIVIGNVSYYDENAKKFVEEKVLNATVGDSIDLYQYNEKTSTDEVYNSIKIGAYTNQDMLGLNPDIFRTVTVVMPDNVVDALFKDSDGQGDLYLYLNSDDSIKAQKEIEEIKTGNVYIYNLMQERQDSEQFILLISIFTYGFIILISLISVANIFNTISTSISLRKREFAMLRSVGMTPKGFNKMINFESIFYGMKALFYGLPISIIVMITIYKSFNNTFDYGFQIPWGSIIFVVVAIFLIVGAAMLYSTSKIRKENIIDGLKQENI
ncbi:MAG TPA: ABC transporter permease [Niallia sp.]|nr:ABC transporter permease [Niallia sp.]